MGFFRTPRSTLRLDARTPRFSHFETLVSVHVDFDFDWKFEFEYNFDFDFDFD